MAFVTFVIPSKGRKTLANTLCSLYEQTNNNWNAVVCFDAVEPTISKTNKIESIVTSIKLGEGHNSAGKVRNYAFKHIIEHYNDSQYIGLVDDDDILDERYVSALFEEASFNKMPDIVLFSMIYTNGTRYPKSKKPISQMENEVGISFAIKREVIEGGLIFDPSSGEDYQFLLTAEKLGLKIHQVQLPYYIVSPLGIAEDRR